MKVVWRSAGHKLDSAAAGQQGELEGGGGRTSPLAGMQGKGRQDWDFQKIGRPLTLPCRFLCRLMDCAGELMLVDGHICMACTACE